MVENTEGREAHDTVRVPPELEGLDLSPKPDGPAAAAMVAAGFGIFVLGLLTTLAEISEGLKSWLESWEFGRGVGPLAGKTTVAVIAWAVAWLVLHLVVRRNDVNLKAWFLAGIVLGILGGIGTFPPVFEAFAK